MSSDNQLDGERIDAVKKPNAAALLPIAVFLVFYLGSGIYFEYIAPTEGQMGFYVMSVVVAFGIALVVAFLQNRSLDFDAKIHLCARGIGDDNITIMLFIFLAAGAFSGIAGQAGGVESTANLLLSFVPQPLAVPGIFLIACIISLSMGTSVGTITVLVPIAVQLSQGSGLPLTCCVAACIGGAMFGDNLSFISDTTIAATRTQGAKMHDKFRANLAIALPAAIIALMAFAAIGFTSASGTMHVGSYNVALALPYLIVLVASICGINVFLVLIGGIILFAIAGASCGTLEFSTMFSSMGTGVEGMFETMIVTVLVASISALVKAHGGFAAIRAFIDRHFHGKRGNMLGIGLFTALMDIATANNTVAIVVTGPIAKDIATEHGIEPRQSASLLDIFSCITQGIIPYGAQLLVASSLAGVASVSLVPWSIYQAALLVCACVWIALRAQKTGTTTS